MPCAVSKFNENNATSPDSTKYFNPITTAHQQFGHGGGLSFMMRGKTHNIKLVIKDCEFTKNHAIWGGGLSIELYGQSSELHITLDNLSFYENYLPLDESASTIGTGGGAVRIAALPDAELLNTSITFTKCAFQNNVAIFGGGVSIELFREELNSGTSIKFTNCTWQNNTARIGSALDAYAHPYPFGKVANFTIDSCNFIENTNHYTELLAKFQGIGTVYLWSIPFFFNNKNTFRGNYGSALVGIDSWFTFQNGAVVVFDNNTANNGGAITLFDNSYLMLYENVQLNFTNNKADGKGGAILVINNGQRDLVSSQYCFVVFHNVSVSPYEWKEKNIKVYFAHNKAKYGNSIFATTLYTCIWGGSTGLDQIHIDDVKQVCYWNKTFMYEGVSNVSGLSQEISSEATYVSNVKKTTYSIPPGKLYHFNFTEKNDRLEKVDVVYFTSIYDNSSVAVVDDTETYTADDFTLLHGTPGSTFKLKMVTDSSLPLSVTVTVQLDDCPPGFYLSSETDSNITVCKCSVNVPGKDYFGIIECDNTKLVASLQTAYYAGYANLNGKETLLTAGCTEGYCYSNKSSYVELPSNSSSQALDDLICKPKNRNGTLCGKCLEDYYIYVNSYDYKCGKCTNSWVAGAFMLFGFKYVPLIVFLYIIGLFSISLIDGPLNSAVLFSQLIPYMNIYAGERISILNKNFVTGFRFLYGPWNLDFIEVLVKDFCVFPVQSALEMLLFKNLTPVVIGCILSILYIWISERCNFIETANLQESSVCKKRLSYIFCECICCKCECLSGCLKKYRKAINWLNRKVCGHSKRTLTLAFTLKVLLPVLYYVMLNSQP